MLAWCAKPKDVRLTQLSHLDWSHLRWLAEHKQAEPGAADVTMDVNPVWRDDAGLHG